MTRLQSRIVTVILAGGAVALLAVAFSMRREVDLPRPSGYRILPAPFPAGIVEARVLVSSTSARPGEVVPLMAPDCLAPPVTVGTAGGLADTVVWLSSVRGGVAPPAAGPSLSLGACGFTPRVTVGMEGSTATVAVPRGEHRLQALLGDVRVFDAAAIGAARIALVSPGMWNVRCATSHPWEQAWVFVAENPYAAVTRADGRVRFADVPAGSYTVKTWNPQRGERAAPILVEVNKTSTLTLRY